MALPVAQEDVLSQVDAGRRSTPRWWHQLRRFARHQPLGLFGAMVIAVLVFLAVFADFVRTSDPVTQRGADILAPPSWQHWFGTNRQGQDLYSRIVYGLRPSLVVGLSVVTIGLCGATVLALL